MLVSSRFCCKMRMLDLSDVPVLVYNMYMCYCTTCMYCQCYCTVENVGHSSGCILQDWCRRLAALAEIASIVLVAELRQLSEQHVLILMIQTRHLSLFGHITQIDDNVDEKMLTTSPVKNGRDHLEWHLPVTWMKTVLDDVKSHNLTLTEAVNMAQNQPVCKLLAMSEHGSEPASL